MNPSQVQGVFLSPAEYVDSDHPRVREMAEWLLQAAGGLGGPTGGVRLTDRDKARLLYYHVRDSISYGPIPAGAIASMADYLRDRETYRASSVMANRSGYCVSKAAVYTALCRAVGIPARVAFADVVNHHFSGKRLRRAMGSDLFAWHGYSEILLDGRWIKVAPTFDAQLCARLGVLPLDFDGVTDALLQPYDRAGHMFFSYVAHHGSFHDVPAGFLSEEMPRLYPGLEGLSLQVDVGRHLDRSSTCPTPVPVP